MSFLRHEEIYRSDVKAGNAGSDACSFPALIGFDEFPAGYSLAGCSLAGPASASPAGNHCQPPMLPYNAFTANGRNPLNSVSQHMGASQVSPYPDLLVPLEQCERSAEEVCVNTGISGARVGIRQVIVPVSERE